MYPAAGLWICNLGLPYVEVAGFDKNLMRIDNSGVGTVVSVLGP
jgi:hypothetical protein